MLALKRPALLGLQRQLSSHDNIRKHYLALAKGTMDAGGITVDSALGQVRAADGRRRVVVDANGQQARTRFQPREVFAGAVLLQAELFSGRMHQARVHAASAGHPIAGDRLYGDDRFNDRMRKLGLSVLPTA